MCDNVFETTIYKRVKGTARIPAKPMSITLTTPHAPRLMPHAPKTITHNPHATTFSLRSWEISRRIQGMSSSPLCAPLEGEPPSTDRAESTATDLRRLASLA